MPLRQVKLDEPVVFPLAAEGGGLSPAAVPEVIRRLQDCDACLVGPGLGRSPGVRAVVEAVLCKRHGAGGSGRRWAECAGGNDGCVECAAGSHGAHAPRWRVPPPGRRCGAGPDGLPQGPWPGLGAVVLLKGHQTVVTDGTRGYENHTGNPGMATGGSGDVLAGLLVSLLAQGLPPLEAAACAAWIHGAAGDHCAAARGQYGLTPSDMIEALPRF